MSFFTAALFSYLDTDERADLEQAFIAVGIAYDGPTRARLLDGVNPQFVATYLPIVGFDPVAQLASDLQRMNRIERLVDGSIPLERWLRNATRIFRLFPQRALFERALAKVVGAGSTTEANVAPAEAAPLDFEEIITDGVDDLQAITFLSEGVKRLPAVVKVLVPRYQGGQQVLLPDRSGPVMGAGTGWLIAGDLLMTNHHVIRNRRQIEQAPSDEDLRLQALGTQALFFFDADSEEGVTIGVSEFVAVGKEKTKDFALLRLAQKPNVPILPLRVEQVALPEPRQTPKGTAVKALAVNIIQHPGGRAKRVALRNNLVYSAEYPTLHYFTDTLEGSSGAPVFDDTWRVIALHRAAVAQQAELNGKIIGYVNQGVQIHAILAALAELAANDPRVAAALDQIRQEQQAL